MPELPIDVIIPCHNYGRFLEEAVLSVLAQSGAPASITVIDDGSTDDSAETAQRLAAQYGIVGLSQHNAGLVRTLRRGISLTQSEFFVVVSADDRVHPDFLARTFAELRRHPAAGYCYPQMEYFGTRSGLADFRPFNARTISCAGNIAGGIALIRRSAYAATPGYAELPAYEDWDLWLSFLDAGIEGVGLAEPLYYWRQHGPQRNAMSPGVERRMRRQVQRRHPRLLLRYYPGYLPTAASHLVSRLRG